MAQRVDKMPNPTARPRPRLYPWDEWLDGHIWRLVQGEDFPRSVRELRSTARTAAARAGMRVITRTTDEPGVVYIQAVPQ